MAAAAARLYRLLPLIDELRVPLWRFGRSRLRLLLVDAHADALADALDAQLGVGVGEDVWRNERHRARQRLRSRVHVDDWHLVAGYAEEGHRADRAARLRRLEREWRARHDPLGVFGSRFAEIAARGDALERRADGE